MRTFFRTEMALAFFLAIASDCGKALPDQSVCAEIEAKSITGGGRLALVWRIARPVTNGNTMNLTPYGSIPVTITEIGGFPGDANLDLRVCAPDCVAAPDSAFGETAKTMTSESGLLVYTVLSGPQSTGTVLVDFGSVNCLQTVLPASTSSDGK